MKDIKAGLNFITLGAIAVDVIFILLGIFFVANPAVGLESALVLIGMLLLFSGVFSIVKFVTNSQKFFKFELIFGLLSIIAGIFAVFKPFDVATLITIIIGVWLIISAVVKLVMAIEFRNLKEETWIFDLTVSALTIILGVMFLINPFKGYMVLSSYAGVMIIIYSGMDMVEQFFIRKRANQILKLFTK